MSGPSISVCLRSFGPLKSLFPADGELRQMNAGASVAGLLAVVSAEGLVEEELLRSAAIAVNLEYAARNQTLQDGDEVAILPPVSGGSADIAGGRELEVALVRHRIDSAAIVNRIKAGEDGAVCVFDGIVRNNTRRRETLHLDYEAYEEMALQQMLRLRTEALEKFGVREVAIVHRLGRLLVGETSILIAVASAHRGAAFDACEWIIDTLKKTVPIWKREQFVDGAVWADGDPFPEGLTAK